MLKKYSFTRPLEKSEPFGKKEVIPTEAESSTVKSKSVYGSENYSSFRDKMKTDGRLFQNRSGNIFESVHKIKKESQQPVTFEIVKPQSESKTSDIVRDIKDNPHEMHSAAKSHEENQVDDWSVEETESASESENDIISNPMSCQYCSVTLDNQVYLEAHLHNVHGQKLGQDSVLSKLAVCAEDETKVVKYNYSERDRAFTSNLDLLSHQLEKKGHKCNTCGKIFDRRYGLTRHMNTHNKPGNSFRCKVCDKRFASRLDLSRHGLTHAIDKLYRCDHCGKTFTEKRLLIFHARTKCTSCKVFKCYRCSDVFQTKVSYTKHMNHHLNVTDRKCAKVKPFKCEHCPRFYCHKKDLRRHHFVKHPQQEYET